MLICKTCKSTFEFEEMETTQEDDGKTHCCPCCGEKDEHEAAMCKECGEWAVRIDMAEGVCLECQIEIEKQFKVGVALLMSGFTAHGKEYLADHFESRTFEEVWA